MVGPTFRRRSPEAGAAEDTGPIPSPTESPGRLIGFTDGVMAVIITITALELRPPGGTDFAALGHRVPGLLVYLLSFTQIGIYWNNHHHLMNVARRISGTVMWANLALLFFLSLLPIATEWVGDDYRHSLPAACYVLVMVLASGAWLVVVRALIRANGRDSPVAVALGSDLKTIFSMATLVAGVALSFASPYAGYAAAVVVSVVWFVPDRRFTRRPTRPPAR